MKNDNANSETIKGSVNIPEMIINLNNEVEDSNISGKIVLSTISNGLTDKQIENINKIPTLEENISKLQTDENNLKDNVAEVQDNLNSLRSTVSQFEDCCNEEKKEIEYTGETIVINSGKESESEKINIKGKTINKTSVGQAEGNLLIISSKGENLFNGLWNKYYYNSPWWNGQGLYKNENVSVAYMSNRIPCTLGKTYYANATNKNRFCVDFYKTMIESEIPFTGYGKTSTTDYYPVDSTVFTVKEPEAKYMEIYLGYDSVPTDVYICEYDERTIQLEDSLRSINSDIYDEIIGNKLIKRIGTDGTQLSKVVESNITGVTSKIFEGKTIIEMSNEVKGELTIKLLEEAGGTGSSDLTEEEINNINKIPSMESTLDSLVSRVTSAETRLTKTEDEIEILKDSTPGSGGSVSSNNAELVINFSSYGSTTVNNNSVAFENAVAYVDSKGGGTILFDKLYKFDGTRAYTLDNKNNITFKGINGGGIIKLHSGRFGFIRNCNNIKFIDMVISGAQTNLSGIVNGDYGIEVHGGENYLFEGCIFKNMRDACLVVGNESTQDTTGKVFTKFVTVNRCQFLNCWQTSTTQNGVYNYWFTNNYIKGGATKFAQRLPNGDNLYILNNVYEVADDFVGNPLELCNYDNVTIENNVFKLGDKCGCAISHYYNTHASTNYYQTHRNVTIRGNKIYNGSATAAAMYIFHNIKDYPAQKLVIEDNSIINGNPNKGISVKGYYDILQIKNNTIKNIAGIGIYIEANGMDLVEIEDNFVNTTSRGAIYPSGTINSLYVKDNIVRTSANGVYGVSATKTVLIENDISASGSAVQISSGTVYTNANILSSPISGGTEVKL